MFEIGLSKDDNVGCTQTIMFLHTQTHTKYSDGASFILDLVQLSMTGRSQTKKGYCYNKQLNGPRVTSLEDRATVYQGVKPH